MTRARHAARNGWFRRPVGRPEQPQPGRHTPEYFEQVAPDIGMHPVGAAGRAAAALNTHDDEDREMNNDPGRLFR